MTLQGVGKVVLVTGASGFLGWHLCEALEADGYEVHTLSRKPNPDRGDLHHVCDLTLPNQLTELLKSRDWYAIFHLAGLISYTVVDWPAMESINVTATRVLLESAIEHCPKAKFIFCSSVVAVGSNTTIEADPVNEDLPWDTDMENIGYARTKRKAEDLVSAAGASGRISTASLCPSNVFGPRDGLKGSRKAQIRAANGIQRMYTRGGLSVVHVNVVVQAFMKLLETPVSDDVWKGTRWLVTGENLTIKDMLTLFSKEGGNEQYAPWLCLPNWVQRIVCWCGQLLGSRSLTMDRYCLGTRYNWYDGSRARIRFGLDEIPAKIAIKESVAWMREVGLVKKRV